MAIKGLPSSREITLEDFKEWLKQFDTDEDGRISKNELREVIRRRGGWFTTMMAGHAVRSADTNKNGFVDESEIENLIDFARKVLGMNITTSNGQRCPRLTQRTWIEQRRPV